MDVLEPVAITDALLVSCSIPEPAASETAWVSGGTYAIGDRRIRATTHRVYRAVTAHSGVTTPPESDTTNWIDDGPTLRWAALDARASTASTSASPIVYAFTAGEPVTGFAIVRASNIQSVSVVVSVGAETIFSQTYSMKKPKGHWSGLLFESREYRTALFVKGLPRRRSATVTITLTGTGTIGVGALLIGPVKQYGRTMYGVRVGFDDYSLVSTDAQFGTTDLTPGNWALTNKLPLLLANDEVDRVRSAMVALRATPTVFAGAGNLYDSLIVFGFIESFEVVLERCNYTLCNVDVRDLT